MSDAPDERGIEMAYAQWQHDQRRGASPMDHSGEIPMLERWLETYGINPYDGAPYEDGEVPAVDNMRQRVLILKAEAGLLPTGLTQ
jgi:hypothetical protein